MIPFDRFTLPNGLRFIVHHDPNTPILAMNILYDVGARDEDPEQTGFAHLFEHLMFGGSVNIPRYDEPLQLAGGENNAFTNSDITNYYLTLPVQNAETAFWLESDRMLSLAFSEKSLEVQRNVVVEEFRQSYLNQPYGDVWLLLKPLAYITHPYQWNTIGKETAHITNASLEDVRRFYGRFYNPNNAIVTVAGNVSTAYIKEMAEKWFGPIPAGPVNERKLAKEPEQTTDRLNEVERDVPFSAVYKAWHMCAQQHPDYYVIDLLSDLLGSGNSSRLYVELVRKQKIFSEIGAFITGDIDPGLFVVHGKVMPGVDPYTADQGIQQVIEHLISQKISEAELRKVKNKAIASLAFENISLLNRAMNLTFHEHHGDAGQINKLPALYAKISVDSLAKASRELFRKGNCNTLIYKSVNKENRE
ncbi:MAG: insulinase family protein [Bacteroidales bacterium]|nr:insulinase family protein [Bacteroidales bacterium]